MYYLKHAAAKMLLGLIALCLLPCLFMGRAGAQTLIKSTDWSTGSFGSATAGTAGTTTGAGDGWIDLSGNKASVNGAPSRLNLVGSASSFSNSEVLLRPASENVRDQRIVTTLDGSYSGALYNVLRWQGANTDYMLGTENNQIKIFRNVSGSLTALGSVVSYSAAPAATDVIRVTCDATGASPTTVTITAYDVTTATTLATSTQTDSTGPQVAGQPGYMGYSNTAIIISSQTYNLSAPPVATSYTQALSASAGNTGSPVTVTYTPNGTTTAVVTPAQTGVTGSFSPTTVTLNGTTPVTAVFTPSTAGTSTITATNSSTLTNPSSATYTVSTPAPSVVVGISSAAWRFSPGNWAGDTGRGGTVYRRSWCNGAYATVYWTASSSPTATLSITNATTSSAISYVLNGKLTDNVTVASTGGIALSGITASAANVLTVYCRNSQQTSRWANANSYKVTDLTLDAGSVAGSAPTWNGRWVLEVGDSITEGIAANNGSDSNLSDYSYLVGQSLLQQGYDYGVSACGYSGWIQTGDGYGSGDVPRYYYVSGGTYQGDAVSRWNQIDSTTSLLDSNSHISGYGATAQEPSAITFNYATNEVLSTLSASDMRLAVTGTLTRMRAAAPAAWLLVYVPFNLYSTAIYTGSAAYITALKGGVSDYQASNPADAKALLIDFGSPFASLLASISSGVHPGTTGHALIASYAVGAILPKLVGVTSTLKATSGQIKRGR